CTDKSNSLFTILPSETSGINFVNLLTETENANILDYLYFYNGGGVAIGDINNDSLPDLYFTGNQVKNKLYLNKGNLQFEDITDKAGVAGESDWNTGVAMGDVNGDGFLDLYVCSVVGINGFYGKNELFINNGDTTFTESAEKYGIAFDNYSSNAAFLDFDLDGDLDIFLLNHAIHNETSFGKAEIRNKRTYESGDKLLRNDNGKFTDISESAGIFGGANGYGLGIAISDFNLDGYPDIYIGNDFHEDDYFYLNNTDGTFSERLRNYFGHTSRFSMGNDVADINHDGYPDLITLDMLAENEKVLKASAGDDSYDMLQMRIGELGYHYQYSRNMLQINNSGTSFTETALLSGVAATDWSWSALFNDYDLDGEQDLFITNGIPKRPNDLDYINFTSNEQVQSKLKNTKLVDKTALSLMPSGIVNNYIFKGNSDLTFTDKSNQWLTNEATISNGAAYGDLDGDGDLDLVTNNLNVSPTVYINENSSKNHYLKVELTYKDANPFGIGTKVTLFSNGVKQYKELYTVRGFQSSSEPIIVFGLGNTTSIDSVHIQWPNKKIQRILALEPDQTIQVVYEELASQEQKSPLPQKALFNKIEDNLGIDFIHKENSYNDFDFQKLIPYQVSARGPAAAVGDLNNDQKDDIYFGGSSRQAPRIYLQKDSTFIMKDSSLLYSESIYEDISAVIEDFDEDRLNDLFVVSGGGEFKGNTKAIIDRLYGQKGSDFVKKEFPELFTNGAAVALADFDKNGHTDIFVANGSSPMDFGKIQPSSLFLNNGSTFELKKSDVFKNLGIATDAIATDFNSDGFTDIIVVGEWMSPKFLKNYSGDFIDVSTEYLHQNLRGLWQAIASFDIDGDGDLDYLLGNWGTNSKFVANEKYPMRMYYGDFDQNKTTETIVAIQKESHYYPIADLDALSKQLVSLTKKKFTKYADFAGKTIFEVFDEDLLKTGTLFEVDNLSSGYLKNEDGKFTFYHFKNELQVAPITSFLVFDFEQDGKNEALAAGNFFGVIPYHGRYDGFGGALIKSENDVLLGHQIGLELAQKSVRKMNIISLDNTPYLLITLNKDKVQVYGLPQKFK
ncbi:MAG: VCBS repeat-containing protein, partial [Flavobacteriaceae bacterium]